MLLLCILIFFIIIFIKMSQNKSSAVGRSVRNLTGRRGMYAGAQISFWCIRQRCDSSSAEQVFDPREIFLAHPLNSSGDNSTEIPMLKH